MTSQNASVVIDNETGEILDETQLANLATQELFQNEENVQKTGNVIASFVDSYSRHKHELPLDVWLNQEFGKYPHLWESDAQRIQTATEIIQAVQLRHNNKLDLEAHLEKGKSKESWLAKKIEQGASAASVVNVGEYAQAIDTALETANFEMADKIFNQSLDIDENLVVSASRQLHGFIAESDLANQFNLNATALNSGLRAQVPSVTTLNSPDVVITDATTGNILESIQVKLYEPNERGLNNLIKDIEHHDYSKMTLMVNKEHVATLREKFPDLKITSDYERAGIKMEMDSYEAYKKLQIKVQLKAETKQYQWNDATRIGIAQEIGKKALAGAALNAGFQGARILGRRVWNALTGKQNQSANEDLQEFFESSLKGAKNIGAQVAVSGGLLVAARSGWIEALKKTPAGEIANIAYVAMENAKCLYKFAKGEMSATETLDAMGKTNASAIGGIAGAIEGAAFGSAFGPVGTFVGGVVGGLAGSSIGEAVYQGGKAIVKTAAKVVKSVYEGVKTTAKSIFNAVTFGLFA
jgi:hypothetical protein